MLLAPGSKDILIIRNIKFGAEKAVLTTLVTTAAQFYSEFLTN